MAAKNMNNSTTHMMSGAATRCTPSS